MSIQETPQVEKCKAHWFQPYSIDLISSEIDTLQLVLVHECLYCDQYTIEVLREAFGFPMKDIQDEIDQAVSLGFFDGISLPF